MSSVGDRLLNCRRTAKKNRIRDMSTYELIEQLAQKPKQEIKYALLALMRKGKIDFLDLNQAYVAMLEHVSEDQNNKLIEAETCVLLSFFNENSDNQYTQRRLYLLNQSKRFNVDEINGVFNYDEAVGKTESWYERNKKEKIL